MYSAIITELTNVRKHPKADRLQLATVKGCQVVVGLDCKNGDVGIYFPSDGQLSPSYCERNNLIRNVVDGVNIGGMFEANRRVRIQKLRGEFSDGFFASLSTIKGIEGLPIGTEFTNFQGEEICKKYVSPKTQKVLSDKNNSKKVKLAKCPHFKEHFDTTHLSRCLENINMGDHIILSSKLHGTSSRLGYLQTTVTWGWFKKTLSKLFGMELVGSRYITLIGTRRVALGEPDKITRDQFRVDANKPFIGNLRKGETIYSEIVGYNGQGTIMGAISKSKLGKEFKHYLNDGDRMVYSYGNLKGECSNYVYRITQTNEDGDTVELGWNQVKQRCGELGVDHVPEFEQFIFDGDRQALLDKVDKLSYGYDTIDSSHIREGVVVRVESGSGMKCYKHKSNDFKLLEDGSKEDGDLEDAS